MQNTQSLKDIILRAEMNGDYYMVGELIESGFNMYMQKGLIAGYNYKDFVEYIHDVYNAYLNYMKLKGKILEA